MIINTGVRTDIPAFYSKWLFNRIDEGYALVRNPYNNQLSKYLINPNVVDCLSFCTKNPKPMLKKLDNISDFNQFWFVTITSYEKDIERNVPPYNKVVKSFKRLSDSLGVNNVSWRYDPIFISDKYSLDYHIDKFKEFCCELQGYANDCTISFIDLYAKVKRNFKEAREVTISEQLIIGEEFSKIAEKYDIQLKTCVEGNLLEQFGFDCSGCMNKKVIEKAIGNTLKVPKENYKVRDCDCLFGRDIGAYNTCMNECIYCYANSNIKLVKRNHKLHNSNSPLLIGDVRDGETIGEPKFESFIDKQQRLI